MTASKWKGFKVEDHLESSVSGQSGSLIILMKISMLLFNVLDAQHDHFTSAMPLLFSIE